MVPGLSMTYIPAKLTRSVEEAKTIAAEYSLVQLGYPMEGIIVEYMRVTRETKKIYTGKKGKRDCCICISLTLFFLTVSVCLTVWYL